MPVHLATATPTQFADVLAFWVTATDIASTTDDRAGLTALHDRDPEALLLATDDGTLVGTLIIGWDGWRGAFYRLAVHPDHRHRGIGRALVTEGETRLRRRGVRRVSLYAVEAHGAAVAFWTALGYTPDRRDTRFVRNLTPADAG